MSANTRNVKWSVAAALAMGAIVTTGAFAQDEMELVNSVERDDERKLEVGKWYPSLDAGFNLTQSAYSDNWNGGDSGSIVWTFLMNGTAENQLSEKVNFFNVFRLAFGQTHRQDSVDGDRDWGHPEKSTDSIDYEGLFRFTLGGFVDPFFGLGFSSQFQDASDPFDRTININPMTFKQTAGIARQFINRENEQLLSRLGFTFHENFRKSFITMDAANTDTESASSTDGGIEWITDYATQILNERVAWTSRFSVYQPLFYSAKNDFDDILASDFTALALDEDIKDFTTEANLSWENLFSTQITKLISVNMYLEWMYDKYDNTVAPIFADDGTIKNGSAIQTSVRKKGQFKQTLALGLTYRFF